MIESFTFTLSQREDCRLDDYEAAKLALDTGCSVRVWLLLAAANRIAGGDVVEIETLQTTEVRPPFPPFFARMYGTPGL